MTLWNRLTRKLGLEAPLTNIDVNTKAPNFSLKALDGKNYSLSSLLLKGPVVAAFFKISCPVCQFTAPFLQRLHERFGGKNATIIGVSQDDARDTQEFNKEFGVTYPTLLDAQGYPTSNAYGLTNVPTIFLIDPDGTVKVTCMGFEKDGLNQIAAELSEREKIPAVSLFRADEKVPARRPG